ncbi:methyl-accepting chemotaxis protein [Fischerella sp. PCC 9605]|uniref:methyl-accepting chemotaxis protein n=1 Tax=Fischerella sp. PCC 9605 TaxID=1173024 RepID=UPI00047D50A5|nr:methyl-accepting chemotaxis protein [Fischerella sp. PCC 9605]
MTNKLNEKRTEPREYTLKQPSVINSYDRNYQHQVTKSQTNLTGFQKAQRFFWNWFSNLSISRKQLIGLIFCEIVSILGIGCVARYLLINNLQALSLEQAKSEIAVTEMAYNVKVNQMGFGFRGQSDNSAIIQAAAADHAGQNLSPDLKAQVKQILANEIKVRKIEYATLVGKDLKIIVNANADRQGENFNPDNLVSEVFKNPQQIKANRIVSWSELSKEAPPLPDGFNKADALIRYTVTPVKDPKTKAVIAALVAGDIVNNKDAIVRGTLQATGGGYSAVYLRKPSGEFALAAALEQDKSKNKETANVALPDEGKSLLEAAAVAGGKAVTARLKIGNQTYTMAAKAVPNKIIEADNDSRSVFDEQVSTVLVRGTPETALNQLLENSFRVELLTIIVALAITLIWTLIIRRTIITPIRKLEQTAQKVALGDRSARAEIFTTDEIGKLAASFNTMADKITEQITQKEKEAKLTELVNKITFRVCGSLDTAQILNLAVITLRDAIKADRVVVYRFDENWMGKIVAECVGDEWSSALGAEIADPCFARDYVDKYQRGRVQALENIYEAGLTPCHIAQLAAFEVKANLVAPILLNNNLYGLLIAHQCSSPRQWKQSEIQLFKQTAIPIGYALEQAYILEQVDKARSRAELIAIEQSQQKEALQQQIIKLLRDIEGASKGDLTVRATITQGEIGTVADFFNTIVENLREIVTKVKASATAVNAALGENEGAIRQLADEAIKQAAEINCTLNCIEHMTDSIADVASNAQKAAAIAHTASNTATEGEKAIDLTVEKIFNLRSTIDDTAKKVKRLGESSQQISRIVSLINEIAVQTNLLAVNAGLEASKASEGSQGFAVVATEVSELAARCSNATQEIKILVENIQRETAEVAKAMEQGTIQVVEGSRIVENAKISLNQILSVSRQIDELVQSISQATVSQVETSQAVTKLIAEISQVSESTSSSSRQISQSLQQTVGISEELQATVAKFKVN